MSDDFVTKLNISFFMEQTIQGIFVCLLYLQVPGNESGIINSDWNCTIAQSGEVSCSDTLYSNPRVWKATQTRVEQEIRKLKLHLEKLKVMFIKC